MDKFGDNLTWMLSDISNADEDQIESPFTDIYGETEEGADCSCEVDIRELCGAASARIATLENTLRENTAQSALIINPECIEQPSHEDFILWLSSYRDEFIAKSEQVELLEREWISVEKDGLPDKDGNYIIFANDIVHAWTEVRRLKTHHYRRFLDDDGFSDYPPIVTHWQPLPEAPQ